MAVFSNIWKICLSRSNKLFIHWKSWTKYAVKLHFQIISQSEIMSSRFGPQQILSIVAWYSIITYCRCALHWICLQNDTEWNIFIKAEILEFVITLDWMQLCNKIDLMSHSISNRSATVRNYFVLVFHIFSYQIFDKWVDVVVSIGNLWMSRGASDGVHYHIS